MKEEDEEEEEEVMVVNEMKKVHEVEMEEDKKAGGALGPTRVWRTSARQR